ncbi:MAG TPA: PorP/SprF family type IX secretion system membrane protein [Cytophagaceae bacterium]|jgi:type IX secretion system PorP/SprF family membrane protein|nr:PorP/SprF family type IX secretion system membrane protein [Cytophagaceae bacterium]
MRIYISILIIFFLTLLVTFSYGQTAASLPVQFIQFYKTYSLINPASIGKDAQAEFNTGNRALTGEFSDIRTFYASGTIRLEKSEKRRSKNVIGLTFVNEKEGTYINRNRASFLYAFHIPLSQRLMLSAGASMGFINYSFKASNINSGGSAFAPNSDIGLWLYRSDFNIGISCNQIIPSRLSPLNATYYIERYYNLAINKSFEIDRHLKLTPTSVFRWFSKTQYDLDIGMIALIQNSLTAVIAYKYKKGASISTGVDNIKIGQNIFKLLFSYYTPIGPLNYYNPQLFELSLNYVPVRKQEILEE